MKRAKPGVSSPASLVANMQRICLLARAIVLAATFWMAVPEHAAEVLDGCARRTCRTNRL